MASKKLHKTEYTSILNNKLNFALYCERNALSTPAIIGHNFGRSFFSGKGIQEISSIGELIYFYAEIFGPTIIEGNEDPPSFHVRCGVWGTAEKSADEKSNGSIKVTESSLVETGSLTEIYGALNERTANSPNLTKSVKNFSDYTGNCCRNF